MLTRWLNDRIVHVREVMSDSRNGLTCSLYEDLKGNFYIDVDKDLRTVIPVPGPFDVAACVFDLYFKSEEV